MFYTLPIVPVFLTSVLWMKSNYGATFYPMWLLVDLKLKPPQMTGNKLGVDSIQNSLYELT